MSVPIKKCKRLFEKLKVGEHPTSYGSSPYLFSQSLYVVVAGLMLHEEGHRSFYQSNVKDKLSEWGYEVRSNSLGRTFSTLVHRKVFLKDKHIRRYRVDQKIFEEE